METIIEFQMLIEFCKYLSLKKKTHDYLKSPYPVRNPELGFFLSGSWVCEAQEHLWLDAVIDTTYDPGEIRTRAY